MAINPMSRKPHPIADRIGRTIGNVSRELFLIFLVLKLVGVIDWSWWWVTAPLWGTVGSLLLLVGATHMISNTEAARV